MASHKVVTTFSNHNPKRHFSINIDATGLAVVPSLGYFDAACRDVLWLEQRLMVDNEIVQMVSNKVVTTFSNQKRHFSINIDATGLAVTLK
jgi:hypothetical protein